MALKAVKNAVKKSPAHKVLKTDKKNEKKCKSDDKEGRCRPSSEELTRRGKRSRNKGASFERFIAERFFQHFGIAFARTPQSGGFAKRSEKADDFRGDILPVDKDTAFLLHCELKNCKTWSLPTWMNQAESDCPAGRKPLVIFHKHNTGKNYVSLSLDDFLSLIDPSKVFKTKEE